MRVSAFLMGCNFMFLSFLGMLLPGYSLIGFQPLAMRLAARVLFPGTGSSIGTIDGPSLLPDGSAGEEISAKGIFGFFGLPYY